MEYIYLLIDNSLYINVDSDLFSLAYYLFVKAKPFPFLERKTNCKLVNYFPIVVRAIRVLEFIYVYFRRRQIYSRSKESLPTIHTTFYGHCLFVSRLGEYKVIDFKKKKITTVFSSYRTVSDVENNLNKLIESQKCTFAPKITEWDLDRRYIKEDFINLKTFSLDYDNRNDFNFQVFPILKCIMTSIVPQVVLLEQYKQELIDKINILITTYQIINSRFANDYYILLEFFFFINKKFKVDSKRKEILLVFSHGDLWVGNILKGKTKSRVIDWSTLEKRSCFFDFYFILFDKVSKMKESNEESIVDEIDQAFECFQLHLRENSYFNARMLSDVLEQAHIYRNLFYLEFILLRFQEYPKECENKKVERWITFFTKYEKSKNPESSFMKVN